MEECLDYYLYYYNTLKESSNGWEENSNTYVPFIENFIVTLYRCYNELDKRFSVINTGKVTKTSRIEKIILNSITPISKSEICYLLPDVSPTTVEYVLGKMVKEDKIVKIGSSKNVRYLKK